MPMDFPDMRSLEFCAKAHKFRKPMKDEKEEDYRELLAEYVESRDFVEAQEIRNKVGWDKWDATQKRDMLLRRL